MGLLGNIFGTPKEHTKEKGDNEVVTTPEFDITQYAKKLAVIVTAVATAAVAALKGFDVKQSQGIVIAVFGAIAAALVGVSLVMATDLAARAYLTGSGAAEKRKKDGEESGEGDPPPDSDLVSTPPGTAVWLEDDDDPHPLLAIASSGGKTSSYLVATGTTVKRQSGDDKVKAIDGAPKWLSADLIRAVKPAKWP